MIYDPYVWFNPPYMIHCGVEAQKYFQQSGISISSNLAKAINESRAASILCLGINKIQNLELRVQLVNEKNEQSTDIRAMYELPMPESNKFDEKAEYWDIQVVTFEKHSPETQVDDFVKRTKFAAKKGYDRETIILCFIDRNITNGKLWKDVHKELRHLKPKNNTFLLGKTHPTKAIYAMARVHPYLDSVVEIDVLEEAKKKYRKPGGALFANLALPNQRTSREPRSGINPFLED